MVKLISADMDGTLLNSNKELPPEFFPLIETLAEKGVRFAAASGRQYYNLEHIFEPVKDKMFFIAENGSMVFENGVNSFANVIDRSTVREIVETVREIPGACPVICGLKSAYAESDEPKLMENIRMYYHRYTIMDDILKAGDDICKIAVYDYTNAEANSHVPLAGAFGGKMEIAVSGEHWVDISNPGCNKGTAINRIQEKYGIGYEETMLFGDYLNDCEMMKTGKYSFAMENAHPRLKEVCRYTAKSNDENGVVEAIRAFFN